MLCRDVGLSIAELETIKAETGWLDAPETIQPYERVRDWIENNFIADNTDDHALITHDNARVDVPVTPADANTPDYEIFRNFMLRNGNCELFTRRTELWGGGVHFTVNANGSIVADMSDDTQMSHQRGWRSTLDQLNLAHDKKSGFLIDSYLANNRHRVETAWYALFAGFRDFPVRYVSSGVPNGGGSMYLDVQTLPAQRDTLIRRIKKLTCDPRRNTRDAQLALNYPKKIR